MAVYTWRTRSVYSALKRLIRTVLPAFLVDWLRGVSRAQTQANTATANKDLELYFHPHDYNWSKQEILSSADGDVRVWRSVSVPSFAAIRTCQAARKNASLHPLSVRMHFRIYSAGLARTTRCTSLELRAHLKSMTYEEVVQHVTWMKFSGCGVMAKDRTVWLDSTQSSCSQVSDSCLHMIVIHVAALLYNIMPQI